MSRLGEAPEERRKAKGPNIPCSSGNGSKHSSSCTTLGRRVSILFAPSHLILITTLR